VADEVSELYQIYFEDVQLKELYPFSIPYKNTLDIFFENSVIARLVPETKADKIGVCSWRLREKQRYYIGRPRPITEEVINGDYEVLSFTKNTKYHKMLANAAQNHAHFQPCFNKILSALGVNCPGEIKNPIYQNHFCARSEIYRYYVGRYLSNAMELITNDPVINEMAMRDSNYTHLNKCSAEHLKDKIGVSYYPMVPFLLERLFSVFVQNEKIKVTYNDQPDSSVKK
jgi:hypothetical protein